MLKRISLYLTSLVFVFTTIGSAYAVTLKASHQWPGTPRADGSYDPRHEMVQIIADEVKKANVGIDIRIYPAKSLYKPKEQWKPMTTGQLDISAFPLAYASKFHPEFDATLMPGTVKNHDHALRFNKGPMMTEIKKIINDAGVVVLSDRQKTGKGMFIDVSMLDCQIAILENAIARYLSKNEIPKPMGSRHPSIAPFEAFKTKDSYIIIAAGNDKLFEKLCNLLQIPKVSKDPKFSDNSSRAKNMDELKKILEEKLLSKKTSDWVSEMEKDKIPCGPIFNIKEAVENPQIESRNMIVKAFHKVVGDFKLAGNPIKMSSYKDEKTRGDIPDLDEHRQKIIKEFCN